MKKEKKWRGRHLHNYLRLIEPQQEEKDQSQALQTVAMICSPQKVEIEKNGQREE